MGLFNVASTAKRIIREFRALRCDDEGVLHIMTPSGYSCDVYIQDQVSGLVNHYLHQEEATPSILSTQSVGSFTIDMSPTTNVDAGDAVSIGEDGRCFQSIVLSKTAASITVASSLDYAFTTAANVSIGAWNLNVNGSGTPQEFILPALSGLDLDIYSISINIIDDSPMDSSLFGSIASLSNGLVIRQEGTVTKNLFLLTNNSGFSEQGFDTIYDPKPPSGVYGVRHTLSFPRYYGVARRIYDTPSDKLILRVQDDLSGMQKVVATVGGHVVVP